MTVLLGLIVSGCSTGSGISDSTVPSTSPSTTAAAATTTTALTGATTTDSTTAGEAFTETTDLVYMTQNGVELLMDVFVPAGDGPWPVVVAFHGLDSNAKDELSTVAVAEAAAADGMLVFTPTWIVFDPPPVPFTVDTFRGFTAAANCAVAFAQESAADLGGDPDTTVLHGFSGGAGAALLAAVEPSDTAISGCETDASPSLVDGAVLGDGEYFLHSTNFDPAFEADLEATQAEVAFMNEATYWPSGLDAKFFMWVAASGTGSRAIGEPSNESGWLALRDPDGSIRADLERLNQLEDGIISNVDAAPIARTSIDGSRVRGNRRRIPGWPHHPRQIARNSRLPESGCFEIAIGGRRNDLLVPTQ